MKQWRQVSGEDGKPFPGLLVNDQDNSKILFAGCNEVTAGVMDFLNELCDGALTEVPEQVEIRGGKFEMHREENKVVLTPAADLSTPQQFDDFVDDLAKSHPETVDPEMYDGFESAKPTPAASGLAAELDAMGAYDEPTPAAPTAKSLTEKFAELRATTGEAYDKPIDDVAAPAAEQMIPPLTLDPNYPYKAAPLPDSHIVSALRIAAGDEAEPTPAEKFADALHLVGNGAVSQAILSLIAELRKDGVK